MKLQIALGCIVASLIGAVPGFCDEPPRTTALKYRLSQNPHEEIGSQSRYLDWSEELFNELPGANRAREWKSAQPIFGLVRLGRPVEEYYIAADHSEGKANAYDTIYFDLNRDGQFGNNERIEPNQTPGREPGTFGPFRVDVASGRLADGTVDRTPQWFTIRIYPSSLRVPGQLLSELTGGYVVPAQPPVSRTINRNHPEFVMSLTNMGYYIGRVQFGDEKLLIGLSDANADGVFTTGASVPLEDPAFQAFESDGNAEAELQRRNDERTSPPDRLLIDRDGDGQFDDRRGPELERLTLGRYVIVKGQYYALDVAPDGTNVTVSPADFPSSTLTWTGSVKSLLLGIVRPDNRRADLLHVSIKGESVTAPAGRYVVLRSDCTVKDADGRDWQFYRQAKSSILDAPAGGTVKLPLGPPITGRFIVTQPDATSGTLTFLLELKAIDGQRANSPPPNQRTPMPQARLTDASGANELAMLDCNLGRAGQWTAVWRIPNKLKGELRVSANFDRWSIPAVSEPTKFEIDKDGRLLPDER